MADKYKHDVLEACLSGKDVLADLKDFIKRLDLVSEIIISKNYSQFHEAINRIIRLIKNDSLNAAVNSELFNSEAEHNLWNQSKLINENEADYVKLKEQLFLITPLIADFFDKVLVMDKDEAVKNNRITLLSSIKSKFERIADFSKIVF